jgi:putative peptide zinc metalloprotease protein
LVLVLPGGARFPVRDAMTIGRADDATIKLDDQTVSRLHARITVGDDGPTIEDAGSRFGVTVSGQRLSEPRRLIPGQEIRLGNVVLRVASAAPAARIVLDATAGTRAPGRSGTPAARHTVGGAANATIVVPVGATEMGLRSAPSPSRDGSIRPRLRSGWALKRVESDPGDERYVLRDLRDDSFLRLDKDDAQLLELLDGNRTVAELLAEANKLLGPSAAGHLARLIADLGERGMLDGVAPTPRPYSEPGFLARGFKSRERTYDWLPRYFQAAYRHWGRMFFSPLAVSCLVLLSLAGVIVFSYLVGARYGTPFLVAHRLLIGGAVFIVGRIAIAAIHELAHGLALAHYRRTTSRAGLRLVFIFPYAFVDTSEAYFEPRTRRIVISAAGPLSDFSLGALFGILCAVSPRGNVRDVFFQLAFAAYVGALFNINPFLDRDGYQILCDWLREPNLRERARRQLRERLSGQTSTEPASPVLARYAFAGLVWTALGAGFVAVLMSTYYHRLSLHLPHGLVMAAFILSFVLLLLPIPIALGVPLLHRARYGAPEVNRAIE